ESRAEGWVPAFAGTSGSECLAEHPPPALTSARSRDTRKDRARSEEHQAEVPQRMQQEDRQHDRTRLEPGKHRDEIKLRRDRKDDRAEQEIDREDVHRRLRRKLTP